jgi:hypothetical protein
MQESKEIKALLHLIDDPDEEVDPVYNRKGNPNQLSKSERKRQEKLKKLRVN